MAKKKKDQGTAAKGAAAARSVSATADELLLAALERGDDPAKTGRLLMTFKEGAMDALATLSLSIAAMTGMVTDLTPDSVRMEQAAGEGYSTATDLADWMVQSLRIPFRDAHHIAGKIVAVAAKSHTPLHQVPLEALQKIEPRISAKVFAVLSVDRSVKSRTSFGGTAPRNVRAQAQKWLKRLGNTGPKSGR